MLMRMCCIRTYLDLYIRLLTVFHINNELKLHLHGITGKLYMVNDFRRAAYLGINDMPNAMSWCMQTIALLRY